MVGGVAKHQAADEDPAFPPPHHGVPQRRRVVGPLDAQPGPRHLPVLGGDARLHELANGGDLTGVGVDAEDGHGPGG